MMFNVLVNDDECVQREGIKNLIAHYGFPFHIMEAENGKTAERILVQSQGIQKQVRCKSDTVQRVRGAS